MNESRFVTFLGEGGCDGNGAGTVIDVSCWGGEGRLCRGFSVWVAVVGDDAFEFASASDAPPDAVEKYADVGVGVTVDGSVEVGPGGEELICTVGRTGDVLWTGLGGEPGSELLKSRLRLLPVGLGLRLLNRDIGLVNPL